jgi:hypothetical protein
MKKRKPIPFNVIIDDVKAQEFKSYDVMPYFIRCYDTTKKDKLPKTFDEFKEFVKSNSMYMYWARCQYEVVVHSWPCDHIKQKIDVHWQIMMNIDVVTEILMRNVLKELKTIK